MPNPTLNQADLAFVVDTTGSMGSFINAARQQMTDVLDALTNDAKTPLDLQVGIVEYHDHPPQDRTFVARPHAFTGKMARVQQTLRQLKPDGGGDAPEAVLDGLEAACEQLTWRQHAHRLAILVGDAPPHGFMRRGDHFRDGCPAGLTVDSVTANLEAQHITLYALGLTRAVQQSFSLLAHYTGGDYFQAARGESAIDAIQTVLAQEFGDLAFDQQILDQCQTNADWTIDALSETLEAARGRVSASLSRLGRRGLI